MGSHSDIPTKRKRFREPYKFLPIVFVVFTIVTLYSIYVFQHCLYLIQPGKSSLFIDIRVRHRGIIQITVFHIVTIMLLICYVRSIMVHPGEIPDKDPQWEYLPHDGRAPAELMPMNLQETKKTGDRRHCKWCGKYKPDRCHHCRVSKTCILKMDHHCPWIYNCVGFANYKFFFLLLFYSVVDCHLIVWTMAESVQRVINEFDTPFINMFLILFGTTLAFFLGVLITLFFGFHVWLMLKSMTTIEFCEKSLKKDDARSYDSSVYDLGFYGNIRAVLGDNVFMWFMPFARPPGDGLNFVSDETRLTKDMEACKGIRRKTHQKTQRSQRHANTGINYGGLSYPDPIPQM